MPDAAPVTTATRLIALLPALGVWRPSMDRASMVRKLTLDN